MRQITSKSGKTHEFHMSAGKGMALNEKMGVKVFSLNSEAGLMQIAGVDPEGGYRLFMEMLKITPEELDDFEVDAIWTFLEGCFTDFFPPRMRSKIPQLLETLKKTVMEQLEKQFGETTSQAAPSNSVTGSAA
jgi:hypothetical protein